MAIYDHFKQFTSMQNLECNNWTILDSLGNIYEIWDKVFKNGPSETCGIQPLKNLK